VGQETADIVANRVRHARKRRSITEPWRPIRACCCIYTGCCRAHCYYS